MKVSIVFHSICGNNYILSKYFKKAFEKYNLDVELLRVEDNNYEKLAIQFDIAKQFKDEIMSIGIAKVEKLLGSDLIILGSPTYYGNVSSAMKLFMDSFSPYWSESKFFGTNLFSFTTCANSEGGGDMCLNAMNIFGLHMGMLPTPIPSNLIPNKSFPAYGFIHYVGDNSDNRPNNETKLAIEEIAKVLNDRILSKCR